MRTSVARSAVVVTGSCVTELNAPAVVPYALAPGTARHVAPSRYSSVHDDGGSTPSGEPLEWNRMRDSSTRTGSSHVSVAENAWFASAVWPHVPHASVSAETG